MAKTIATIRGTMLAPGISKNNRMYTQAAIGRMVSRMQERLSDPTALPVVMRTHHDAGDDSRRIVGRVTSVQQEADGRATYEAKLYDTQAGRDIAALIDPEAPALRTTSIYGYWVGPTSETKREGKRVEVGEDLAVEALDFTASPGVAQSRLESVTFESSSALLAPIGGESSLDGRHICETYDATVEIEEAYDEGGTSGQFTDEADVVNYIGEDYNTKQRKAMAAKGQAMQGGRYPIANKSDLRKAIHAVGRGNGSHAAIRQHIIKRAKALGLMDMIPDNWTSSSESAGERISRYLGRLEEHYVEVSVADADGNPIVKVCADDVDPDFIRKAAKVAGKMAARIVDSQESDADMDTLDDENGEPSQADDDEMDDLDDAFVVKVGSDPMQNKDSYESFSLIATRKGESIYERTLLLKKTSTAPAVENQTDPEEETAVSESEETAAQAAPGLSEADLAKLGAIIGASVKEAMVAAAEAAAVKAEKKKKNKPANTDDNSGAAESTTEKADAVKESGISAEVLEQKLAEAREAMKAELRESILKESGIPQRKGYRYVKESDTDVNPTGDELWDKRMDYWNSVFGWNQSSQAATAVDTAASS